MTAPTAPPASLHFGALDGYRALAAALIVVAHTWVGLGYVEDQPILDANRVSFLGVAMFFSLSGFLLYRPFVLAHLQDRPVLATRVFLQRRLVRIFPIYWVVLTAYLLILETPGIGSVINHVKMYLLLQVYDTTLFAKGIPAAWTLCVELTFYLAVPFLAATARRLHRWRLTAVNAELTVVIAFFAVGPIWRYLWFRDGATGLVDIWLPAQADFFAMGMGLAVVHSANQALDRPVPSLLRRLSQMPWLGLVITAELLWLLSTLEIPIAPDPLTAGHQLSRFAIYVACAFLLIAPMVFGDGRSLQARFLASGPMHVLSSWTYGLYLWHMIVLLRVSDWLGGADEATFWPVFSLGIVISLFLAAVGYRLIEVPANRLRDVDLRAAFARRDADERVDPPPRTPIAS